MDLKIKKTPGKEKNELALFIEAPKEISEKAYGWALREAANDLDVPGFRKGKVPKDIVEKQLGKSYISKKAFEKIFYEVLFEVVIQEKLDVVDILQIDSFELLPEKPLTFNVTVVLKPVVTLGEYKNLKIQAKKFLYKEGVFVKRTLEKIANNLATYKEVVNRGAQIGDKLILDFHGKFFDGTAVPGGDAENSETILEKDKILPEFVDKLVGLKTGETKNITIKYPKDYKEELAEKEALFNVTVKKIEEKVLPKIDNDLAQKVNINDLEELKKKIESEMVKVQDYNSNIDFENKLVEEIISSSKFEISERMIDKEIDNFLGDLKEGCEKQGKNWNEFKIDEKNKELFSKARDAAIKRISIDLVLNSIIQKEKIVATKEEIDAEVQSKILQYGEQYKNLENDKRFRGIIELGILRNRVIDYLIHNNEPIWEEEILQDVDT